MSRDNSEEFQTEKLQVTNTSRKPHISKARDKQTIIAGTPSLKARTKMLRNNDTEDKVKYMVDRCLYYY